MVTREDVLDRMNAAERAYIKAFDVWLHCSLAALSDARANLHKLRDEFEMWNNASKAIEKGCDPLIAVLRRQ